VKSVGLLVLILAAFPAQDPTELPKQPIQNFRVIRRDLRHDPRTKTDIDEVTLILEGDEAIPIKVEKGKEVFDLRGVKARYFTEPDRGKMSKEIQVTARRGTLNNEARTLRLDDDVRVVRKNDDETPSRADTVLRASTLLLRFNRMYECPECRKLEIRKFQKRPGRCLDHNVDLKEATITSVEAERDFDIAGPEGILSGHGLVTDDAIKKDYHISRDGFAEFEGKGPTTGDDVKTESASAPTFSQVFSRGPLEISGPEDARRIKGCEGMRVDRIDPSGTLTIRAQDMTIDTFESDKTSGALELGNVDASGKVIMEGVQFADGTTFHTTSDTLARRVDRESRADEESVRETTDLKSTGEHLVHVKAGASTIESRSVRIHRRIARDDRDFIVTSEFEDVERSDLVAGAQHFSMKCVHLTTTAGPDNAGRTNLRRIQARQNVRLGGLMAGGSGEDPGKAEADVFEWDVVDQRGWLEATPLVRLTQGSSTITAPKVVLEAPDIFVLKGPKQVHLAQEHDGMKEDYHATCDGDLVLDQRSRRLTMRERCVIRTKDLLLHSDRVNAVLTPPGANQGLESMQALGRVSALRLQDHTMLYGDRLAYQFKDQNLRVYGGPNAVADTGRVVSTQEMIRVYDKINPRTGLMTRYTELIGGAEGVRIESEEKASEQPVPSGKKK
jgi:hypothetical protein